MRCILFDTEKHEDYYPFSLNHATFEVRMGAFTGIERIIKDNNLSVVGDTLFLSLVHIIASIFIYYNMISKLGFYGK